MIHPTVFNTAQVCHQFGVKHAVMSPGSRNAPLTISFARHPDIRKWIIPDERAAGFVALGIAQENKSPVVLCCTSGSALLNYAPAIAEAYYREIPLIVLSADRPPELIDQRDGQTIRQFKALDNHVLSSTKLPLVISEQDAEEYEKILIESLAESSSVRKGPVHINIPFKEPFYPKEDQELSYRPVHSDLAQKPSSDVIEIPEFDFSAYEKVLVLVGQTPPNKKLDDLISAVADKVPVVKSPLNNLTVGIEHVDGFIANQSELKPDLLLTCGLSVLSKKLKNYIRSNRPKKHIHFDVAGIPVDTYGTDPEIVKASFEDLIDPAFFDSVDNSYLKDWKSYSKRSSTTIDYFLKETAFSEVLAAAKILESIPRSSTLHLSNSMPVRYADLFGVRAAVKVEGNRGTSGIDGCTSTAVGASLTSDQLHVLLTGDLAFLYDRNAFFHNYPLPNLRVIVLNNQGGGIFRLIDGPAKLPELEEYFETRHDHTAEYICKESGLRYEKVVDIKGLKEALKSFYEPSKHGKIIEVFTSPEQNQKAYKTLKTKLNE